MWTLCVTNIHIKKQNIPLRTETPMCPFLSFPHSPTLPPEGDYSLFSSQMFCLFFTFQKSGMIKHIFFCVQFICFNIILCKFVFVLQLQFFSSFLLPSVVFYFVTEHSLSILMLIGVWNSTWGLLELVLLWNYDGATIENICAHFHWV